MEILLMWTNQLSQRHLCYVFHFEKTRRDGVSEGQFSQVLLYEMDAIRKACLSLEANYLPSITFVVVRKRHHTRLFPTDNQTDRSGNIQPGTVVDTKICHPTEFDFCLNSHTVIQGSSQPTYYRMLNEENNFTANLLQVLTNNLCYMYARCTQLVSIGLISFLFCFLFLPPTCYARLVALQARYYIEGDTSNGGSTGGENRAEFRRFPLIKDNVNNIKAKEPNSKPRPQPDPKPISPATKSKNPSNQQSTTTESNLPKFPSKSHEDKVVQVYRRKWVIHIERITQEKVNGSTVNVGVNHSKVVITKLRLDKDRKSLLDRKAKGRAAADLTGLGFVGFFVIGTQFF
ncbi:hypothetical protein CMV_003644 [Castanea mollissima]|uniref:Piwi domain-containing protein n=1 Tax=Castanea mollissima TaxID=60419 RepID=A0A8J4VWA9_9ROSI|nr:hypothetical protein CMV_003644 [Castanea mollissima]